MDEERLMRNNIFANFKMDSPISIENKENNFTHWKTLRIILKLNG